MICYARRTLSSSARLSNGPPWIEVLSNGVRDQGEWHVARAPMFRGITQLQRERDCNEGQHSAKRTAAAACLSGEPWSNDWTIVRAAKIQPAEALAHAIMWAHFRSELASEVFSATAVTGCPRFASGVGRQDR